MKISKKSGIVVGGIAGAMMVLAPAAYAASTVIVDGTTAPGPVAVTGVNAGPIAFNTTGSMPSSCMISSVSGKINRGASATSGSIIGQIDALSLGTAATPCSATALNLPFLIEKNANPTAPATWDIELTATPAKGAATAPIVIREMSLKMHSTGNPPWVYELKADGDVTGTFNQTTQQVSISTPPGFPLDITTFNGAGTDTPASSTFLGLITDYQFFSMAGSFTLSTPEVGGIHW